MWLTREDVEDPRALMVREVLDRVVRSREVTAGGRELLETHRFWKKKSWRLFFNMISFTSDTGSFLMVKFDKKKQYKFHIVFKINRIKNCD